MQAWKCSHSRLYWFAYDGTTTLSAWGGRIVPAEIVCCPAVRRQRRGDGSIPWTRTVVARSQERRAGRDRHPDVVAVAASLRGTPDVADVDQA
jgi:hypothetical protein